MSANTTHPMLLSAGWNPAPPAGKTSALLVGLAHALVVVALIQLGQLPLATVAPTVFATLISEAAAPTPTSPARPLTALAPAINLAPATVPLIRLAESGVSAPHEATNAVPPAPTFAAQETAIVTPARFDADYLHNPAPHYPPLSRRAQEQGQVVLRVRVDERGDPLEVSIHLSSGFARLDQAALATVKRWKFVPARRGDAPLVATVLVPIDFSLTG